jgi:uncharacterized membrane protein
MKVRTLLLLIILVAIGAFAALNWSALTAPTSLSLGVAAVQGPLGLIMLGLLAFVTALFLVFVIYLQASMLLDARRHARELEANRRRADEAEVSRFTELRAFLDAELKGLTNQGAQTTESIKARLDQLDHDFRSAVQDSGNTLAAYIGELEDRLERGARGLSPDPVS